MTTTNETGGQRPDTLVFVHGLWMTPKSWEQWAAYFEARGWKVVTPAWPGFDRAPEEIRAAPGSEIGQLTPGDVIDSYAKVIEALDTPAIAIGHSFGGAFAQVLLSRGVVAGAVALSPAPLKGVLGLPLSTLRSSFGVLGNPLNFGKAVPFNKGQFRYAFGNTLTEEQSDAAWEAQAVPAASKVLFYGAAANAPGKSALSVDWKDSTRGPLLVVGAGNDHVVPAGTSAKAAKKYAARTDYLEYPDRSHFLAGEPGWEEIAGAVEEWLTQTYGPR